MFAAGNITKRLEIYFISHNTQCTKKNTICFYNMAIHKTFTMDIAILVENMEHEVGNDEI